MVSEGRWDIGWAVGLDDLPQGGVLRSGRTVKLHKISATCIMFSAFDYYTSYSCPLSCICTACRQHIQHQLCNSPT